MQMGIPIDEIQCYHDKVLMESPSGKPVCLTVNSSIKLMDRGYTLVETLKKDTQVENTPKVVPTGELPQTNIDGTTVLPPDLATKDDPLEKTDHLNHSTQDITNNTSGNNHKITKEIFLSSAKETFTLCDQLGSGLFKYDMVDLKYIMRTGKVQAFCVQPHYNWFEIHLQTQGPGTLTVEIPKDVIDLRQIDYPLCLTEYDVYTNLQSSDETIMKQIMQTDSSRIIQFSWEKAPSKIGLFGEYRIINGVDYSEPNYCINEIESEEQDISCHKRVSHVYPYYMVDLEYTLSTGKVLFSCVQPDHKWLRVYLQTEKPGTLAVEIPKDIVDLRQFDYPSCYAKYDVYSRYSLDADYYSHDRSTMKQISETDSSRTIEFTWDKPIFAIGFTGQPNQCISKVESGEQSAEIEE